MDIKLRIAGVIAAVAVSIFILSFQTDPIPIPQPPTSDTKKSVDILATNLEKPVSIAFDKGGDRIFITEKVGRIRVVQNGTLLNDPLVTLRTVNVFDGGLLGITTHPNFDENHFLYVYHTYEEDDKLWNKVVRITESKNKLVDAVTILDKIPGSAFTNGGVMEFGPDGKLYVGTGSVSDSSHLPQDMGSLAGKVLRVNDDGTIPDDNPFGADSPVYTLGHRNPKGMTWDKESGQMYLAEQGPTKNDEINIIKPGKNYGWPEQQCSSGEQKKGEDEGGEEQFVDALICYDPSIEPGGIVIYYGNKLPYKGELIMASLVASNLYTVDLEKKGGGEDEEVSSSSQRSILSGLGRLRNVAEGPDEHLYILTSNTDGKGFPDSQDDKLLRIAK